MNIATKTTQEGHTNLHMWRTGLTHALHHGPAFRREWTNLYFSLLPQPPDETDVLFYDIRQPLPFADNSFHHVYAMHVIEHLTPAEGLAYLQEIRRVLKPGGICRISTPDLEDIVRNYVRCFQACLNDRSETNQRNYHWAMLEVFDQLCRHKSGGEMCEAVKTGYFDEAYLKERYGEVYHEFDGHKAAQMTRDIRQQQEGERRKRNGGVSFPAKIKRKIENKIYYQRLNQAHKKTGHDPRKTLETNRWMYDRFSLRLLMEKGGLTDYRVHNYKTSDIEGWERYQFDRSNNGERAIEPSLYAEARRPGSE
jgi:predicted SAM-dependent methyltransferase